MLVNNLHRAIIYRLLFHKAIMAANNHALLLSSSNCHGYSLLEFAHAEIDSFLKKNSCNEILFVPYAQKDYDKYTARVRDVLHNWGYKVVGIHTSHDPVKAMEAAQAVFVGGGNTFLLLKTLYENNLVQLIRKRVSQGDLLYMGSSAGTNVATKSIHTTNDMPITLPPSFNAIGIVPFNINPHYIDVVESQTHMGETRDQRIMEFMEMPHAGPVLGLREGSILHIEGNSAVLKGAAGAVLFMPGQAKQEYRVGTDLSYLLQM